MKLTDITTLGGLKAAGYTTKKIKDELRDNLIESLKKGRAPFTGIHGYEDTVVPDIQRAILSRHNIILLGLRGQAKTKIARLLVQLLDEYVPYIAGSEINDDPFYPISKFGKDLTAELGDATPIAWLHRNSRYTEKLATPDVTTADLLGDVDPIKAATLKLPYSDERVIHFGLIPHSNRSIFVINELPDLQARIQVALFNILQEEDIQIRGFKMRLPLDVQFVFTANPEDYTNRGSIVTPLKDRIDSQILTHYPRTLHTAKAITLQEAKLTDAQRSCITTPDLLHTLVEQAAFEARKSEYVDSKSGVSARLTISAYENLFSAAERRMLINGERNTFARVSDLFGVLPSITGKVELVYEGEQEGPAKVAMILLGKSIRTVFNELFPNPEKFKKAKEKSPYQGIIEWFSKGNVADFLFTGGKNEYTAAINAVPGLIDTVRLFHKIQHHETELVYAEFLLYGLAEHSMLGRERLDAGMQFKDMISSMFTMNNSGEEDDLNENDYYR